MLLEKVKQLCQERKISLAELERSADLLPRSVYKWNESIPAADKLARVAKILGTTVEDLLEE